MRFNGINIPDEDGLDECLCEEVNNEAQELYNLIDKDDEIWNYDDVSKNQDIESRLYDIAWEHHRHLPDTVMRQAYGLVYRTIDHYRRAKGLKTLQELKEDEVEKWFGHRPSYGYDYRYYKECLCEELNNNIFIKCDIPQLIKEVVSDTPNFFDFLRESDLENELNATSSPEEVAQLLAESEYWYMEHYPENYSAEYMEDGILLTPEALDNLSKYKDEIISTLYTEYRNYIDNDNLGWEKFDEYMHNRYSLDENLDDVINSTRNKYNKFKNDHTRFSRHTKEYNYVRTLTKDIVNKIGSNPAQLLTIINKYMSDDDFCELLEHVCDDLDIDYNYDEFTLNR